MNKNPEFFPPRKQAQLSECLSGAKLDPSIVANVTKKCLGLVDWLMTMGDFPTKRGEKTQQHIISSLGSWGS